MVDYCEVMFKTIQKIEDKYKKPKVVDVRSGDTVRVHQRITEGSKSRVQVFEGLVIRTSKPNSLNARILVRRIASGVGVEKSFLLHAKNVEKIEVTKRSKVRRNYLSYMRERSGKSARLSAKAFDKDSVNDVSVPEDETREAKEAQTELNEEKIAEAKVEDQEKIREAADEAKAEAAQTKEESKQEDDSDQDATNQANEKDSTSEAETK